MPACGWEVDGCDCCDAFMSMPPARQAEIEAWAINKLWTWTRERFGLCEVTFDSDDDECCIPLGPRHWWRGCSYSEIVLPGPINEPISVTVGDVELGPEDLEVYDWNILKRIDGGSFRGHWSATYMRGEPVPPGGGLIAGTLACEYAKSLCNDGSCRFPKRVTSVTRQGITMGMLDDFAGIESGKTGIWEIDDWISSQNRPAWQSRVFSPDLQRPRRLTWSYASS